MKRDLQIVKALIKEMYEGSTCNECGGAMYEGECVECGYIEEGKLTYTDEYDDDPKLTGKQKSNLPDQLQKAIINKEADSKEPENWKIWQQKIDQGYAQGYEDGWRDGSQGKPKDNPKKSSLSGIGSIIREDHEGTDHEVSMANNSLDSILWAANELKKHLGDQERDIPAWIQDHITNAENYIIQAAKNFHDYGAKEAPEGDNTVNEYGDDSGGQDMTWGIYNRGTQKNTAGNREFMLKGYEDYYDGVPFDKCPFDPGYNQYYKIDLAKYWEAGWLKAKEEDIESESERNEMSLEEMIKKVGSKYNVYSKKGKKLGSHPSKKKAQKQMAAIEISKQGK